MIIILNLKSLKICSQTSENNSKFHSRIHGWIYNKIKDTEFSGIYEKKEFNLFCFSNLFSIEKNTLEEEKLYQIIISSPNEMFIITLLSNLNLKYVEVWETPTSMARYEK